MLASIPSATLLGARGHRVHVEVHVAQGLPTFTVVGLPDETVREARDRVRAAVQSSELPWPQQRITVNLAPGGLRKAGAGLDLPIAVGVLVAVGALAAEAIAGHAFVGELGLDGSVRRVPGMVPLAGAVEEPTVVVPAECAHEAAIVAEGRVRGVPTLRSLVEALTAEAPWPTVADPPATPDDGPTPDLADVRGHGFARRALEVAAAGGHHLLMVGPPGSGKTMLAQRLPGLLPPLDGSTALEVTMLHSAAGVALPPGGLITRPPLRQPHHTSSVVAVVGGGTSGLRPGEASLSHGGVLFMDELGEFHADVLDGLREPLEAGVVHVTRARAAVTFPARFVLVAAMNPCPCGLATQPGACSCPPAARARYLQRVSGPIFDRFDLRLGINRPSVDELLDVPRGEPTAVAAARVAAARVLAVERSGALNATVASAQLDEVAPLDRAATAVLRRELEVGRLTGRGLARVRRVARTVADLDGRSGRLEEDDIQQALQLRGDPLDLARRVA
jgi:magnesium chelatase family protein